ncbi:MAG: TusE/DsrC/DsvC family sulfur relay protein [Cocleimonas sp.]
MALTVNGNTIETTEAGYLVDLNEWNEDVCAAIAKEEGIEITDKHLDVITYLRDEYINNGGSQPMERAITKHMSNVWGEKLKGKDLYNLFPGAPSKQGLKLAGLPATTRKGGY